MRSILSNCQGAEVWREALTGVVSEASKDTCPGALKVEFAESKSTFIGIELLDTSQLTLTRDLCLCPSL